MVPTTCFEPELRQRLDLARKDDSGNSPCLRILHESSGNFCHPPAVRPFIVIDPGDDVARRGVDRPVSSPGESGAWLDHIVEVQLGRLFGGHPTRLVVGRCVVHHQNPKGRVVLRGEAVQALPEQFGAAAGADGHADLGSGQNGLAPTSEIGRSQRGAGNTINGQCTLDVHTGLVKFRTDTIAKLLFEDDRKVRGRQTLRREIKLEQSDRLGETADE